MPETNAQTQAAKELLDPQFLKKLEQLQITAKKVFGGRMRGERRSKRRGVSIEFADYRDYVRGDDLRHIDWNIYGRLDRFFLKLFMEELDLFFYIILDASKSMEFGDPQKLLYAKKVAAALAYIGLTHQDKVAISAFANGVKDEMKPARGRAYVWRMLEFLQQIEPDGQTSLGETCKNFVQKNRQRGIVVLISDFLDQNGYEDALKYFLHGNYEVFVIHVLDKEEMEPEMQGHMELIDCEFDDKAEVSVTPALLKQYRRTVEAYCTQIRDYSTRYGMTYLLSRTDLPFDELIMKYLREKGMLK
ncbi:DUF58 domain-containing protein [Candidatus Sumerlaeota bacterium]|nr:DUF58 domain-containing protein [Candidatus Sumerlaeota bacterium]